MKNDNLDTLDDSTLNELFAVDCGWQHRLATHESPVERCGMKLPNHFGHPIEAWWHETSENNRGVYACPPPFCTDANTVLPWLKKRERWISEGEPGGTVLVYFPRIADGEARAATFPRAAVIALLRAKRATP